MKQQRPERQKVTVHHDSDGQIVALILADAYGQGPPTGIVPEPGCACFETVLDDALAHVSLLDIHTQYRVEVSKRGARLVQAQKSEDC